jgi:hypothetical protein
MIRPVNDFRIGNLVLDEDSELCKIEQLSSSKMERFQQVSNIENKFCISTKYQSNIYAIKLTELNVLNLGFTKDNSENNKTYISPMFDGNVIKIYFNRFGVAKFLINTHFQVELPYIHSLQNLFFVLSSGEELVFSSTEP